MACIPNKMEVVGKIRRAIPPWHQHLTTLILKHENSHNESDHINLQPNQTTASTS